ncbi:MAG: YbjN domain-containing protein [Clostridia bacterium]|nr:YbjN domain-containing protein [Clostridia bacterium]
MIHTATRAIQQTFDEKGVKYRIDERGEVSSVEAGFTIENGPNVIIRFISTDDDNDVAIRVLQLLKVTDAKRDSMLTAINQLNDKFRFLKFVMDDNGNVSVENDLCLCAENVGDICFEIFVRSLKIIKDAYPVLMRALL